MSLTMITLYSRPEEGLKYRIGATLGTLPDYTVSIYAPGQSSFASQTVSGSGSLTATFWTARDTGECFLNVQSLSGNSGTYSLTITAVEASPEDDHGDDRASATRVIRWRQCRGCNRIHR